MKTRNHIQTMELQPCARCGLLALPDLGLLACAYHPGKRESRVYSCCGRQEERHGCTACDHALRGSFVAAHLPPRPSCEYVKLEHARYLQVNERSLEAGRYLLRTGQSPIGPQPNDSVVLVARFDAEEAIKRGGLVPHY